MKIIESFIVIQLKFQQWNPQSCFCYEQKLGPEWTLHDLELDIIIQDGRCFSSYLEK